MAHEILQMDLLDYAGHGRNVLESIDRFQQFRRVLLLLQWRSIDGSCQIAAHKPGILRNLRRIAVESGRSTTLWRIPFLEVIDAARIFFIFVLK